MRLDHLLSRENRVETIGAVSALKAPMVDRASVVSPSSGGARRPVLTDGAELGSRPDEDTDPYAGTPAISCHSSRVKGAAVGANARRRRRPTPAHRATSSAGRASPLQGEGQEFESPRLHHPADVAFARRSEHQLKSTGSTSPNLRESGERSRYDSHRPSDPCA